MKAYEASDLLLGVDHASEQEEHLGGCVEHRHGTARRRGLGAEDEAHLTGE